MAMQQEAIVRKFSYNGLTLADPDPTMPADEVRAMYARQQFPELNNSVVEGPTTKGNESVYTFARAVGSKG